MVAQQVRPCEVIDEHVLKALGRVPREAFIPEAYRGLAFADVAIPLPEGQFMMKPLQEARMLQALALQTGERVLEIGTGSGFISACLADMGAAVVSYEIRPALAEQAAATLAALDVSGVSLRTGNGLQADLPAQSFDAIAVTGSLPTYDERLEALLAPGGRMFVVVGEAPAMRAMLVQRDPTGAILRESQFETELAALDGAVAAEQFHF
jgi:protein-L-isoaspartate(D-aspartate) O-methyltransferase